MTEKVRVVVIIQGGVCQAAYAGEFVEVLVIDYDDAEDDPEYAPEISGADAWTADVEAAWAKADAARQKPLA